jgi:hypothetical protein
MALAGDFAGNLVDSFLATALRATVDFFAAVVFPARRGRTRVSDVLKVQSTSFQGSRRNRRIRSIEANR